MGAAVANELLRKPVELFLRCNRRLAQIDLLALPHLACEAAKVLDRIGVAGRTVGDVEFSGTGRVTDFITDHK